VLEVEFGELQVYLEGLKRLFPRPPPPPAPQILEGLLAYSDAVGPDAALLTF